MKKEKGIDDIFKHGLENPADEAAFDERGWDALENMLDKKTGGGKVVWLRYLSAAAAVVVVAFCWWMFKPQATTTQNTQQAAINKPAASQPVTQPKPTGAPQTQPQVAAAQQPQMGDEIVSKPAKAGKDNATATQQNNVQQQFVAGTVNKGNRNKQGADVVLIPRNNTDIIIKQDAGTVNPDNIIVAATPSFNITPTNPGYRVPVLASADVLTKSTIRPLAASKVDIKKTSMALRPQFALTVLASPELNGVGSFQSASKGTNIGLMFTVGVKKFSLTTGASYSLKPYSLPYSQYPSVNKYKTTPETVTADCRILDIPINIGYQLYNKSRNKITVGTGMSSYIMMHESYTYDYAASAKKVYGPSYYSVPGKGKYMFSIMNVQATYERQINSKVGLSLQPYYKIPLSEIGYSQVKVQTFGVAVGLNWNINSLTKPK
jgi:hypothetical protein